MASKRPTVSAPTVNGCDRISSLPDAILSHILSFLPTEDSVRTRALSSRWKHLFSLVPVLDFQYHSFSNLYRPLYQDISSSSNSDSNSSSPIDSDPDRTLIFLDFVNWVFNSYNVGNMKKFRFSGGSVRHPENSRVLSWISESIRRQVGKLHVSVSFHEPQRLPRGIFTCESITYLSLDGNFVLDVPEDVYLPHVKKLELCGLEFIDVDSFRRFFRNCPVLEYLFLQCCRSGDTQILDISIPSLKILTIIHATEDKLDLVLDLPNVEIFCYLGSVMEHPSYSFQGFKLLKKADICFDTYTFEGFKALDKLVNAVCHTRNLKLSWSIMEALKRSGRLLPIFSNLTHLEISDISCHDSGLVLDILDRTPHLEVLIVGNGNFFAEDYDESSVNIDFSSARVPICVSLNLKEVRFEVFLMLENEFKLVEYLLANAKVLDTLKIKSEGGIRKQFEMSKRLLNFSRWSRACRIVIDPCFEEI